MFVPFELCCFAEHCTHLENLLWNNIFLAGEDLEPGRYYSTMIVYYQLSDVDGAEVELMLMLKERCIVRMSNSLVLVDQAEDRFPNFGNKFAA